MLDKKILLGLTTTKGSDYRKKIREINDLKIKEIALFLTGIDKEKRNELYSLLEKTNLEKIYHVHLRNDMDEYEIDYLIKRFQVEVFNIHSQREFYKFDLAILDKISQVVFIENSGIIPDQEELDNYGGLCVDFSHWEVGKNLKKYKNFKKLVENNKVGCCHISGVSSFYGFFRDDRHFARNKKELDYVKKYKDYLPSVISLELENDFWEQLIFKDYIEEILGYKN